MSLFPNCAFCPWNRFKQTVSYLRILHASPGMPAVDIYAGSVLLAENLGYRSHTDYLPLLPGEYVIRIFPTGRSTTPALTSRVSIPANTTMTAAFEERLPNLTLFFFPEPVPTRQALIRFTHLSPNAPRVDVTLSDGTVLFHHIGYGEQSLYTPMERGIYTFQVRATDTQTVILSASDIDLRKQNYYTLFATGLVGGVPPLQALLLQDYGKS